MAQIYWPVDPSQITEGYGWSDWRQGIHDGIDFKIAQGSELRATASGIVTNVYSGEKWGAGVDITTPDGWVTRHWHVSKFLLANGSRVEAGDVIALSGGAPGTWGAGWSTGPHLHWGVRVSGRWVDPKSLNPQFFGSSTNNKGKSQMLMIHIPNGDGQFRYAVFAPGFWLEFVGFEAASGFALQIGGNSVLASADFWNYCKNASQTPINVKGATGSAPANVDVAKIATAVNDEMAKRMKS